MRLTNSIYCRLYFPSTQNATILLYTELTNLRCIVEIVGCIKGLIHTMHEVVSEQVSRALPFPIHILYVCVI